MPDWYRDHDLSPDAYPDSEYLAWAQDKGLHADAAGNVDYGLPEPRCNKALDTRSEVCPRCFSQHTWLLADDDVTFPAAERSAGLDDWEF